MSEAFQQQYFTTTTPPVALVISYLVTEWPYPEGYDPIRNINIHDNCICQISGIPRRLENKIAVLVNVLHWLKFKKCFRHHGFDGVGDAPAGRR